MIFFSYCWSDENVFKFIQNFIKVQNLKENQYYLDREHNKAGQRYWNNIRKSLNNCSTFIFFNSKNYYNSGPCCKEYVWALNLEKNKRIKIIEIKVHETNLYRPFKDQISLNFLPNKMLLTNLAKALNFHIINNKKSKQSQLVKVINPRNIHPNVITKFKILKNVSNVCVLSEEPMHFYLSSGTQYVPALNFLQTETRQVVRGNKICWMFVWKTADSTKNKEYFLNAPDIINKQNIYIGIIKNNGSETEVKNYELVKIK